MISEHSGEIDGLPVVWRSAPASPGTAPALYLHGVPTSSEDWIPFLERAGGVAPDLPGFGRSGKPGHFDYSIDGYAAFLEEFVALAGLQRFSLVIHDWGAVGLVFAQRHPERIERLVVINALPFLPGYRWHRMARLWRTPVVGELTMGSTTPRVLRFISRESNATPGPMPPDFLDRVLRYFDHGTQRAILRLYRSAPPDALAAAGANLGSVSAPALVLWGDRDPYIAPDFGEAYAAALPHAELVRLPDAGHWPWMDDPGAVTRVVDFLSSG